MNERDEQSPGAAEDTKKYRLVRMKVGEQGFAMNAQGSVIVHTEAHGIQELTFRPTLMGILGVYEVAGEEGITELHAIGPENIPGLDLREILKEVQLRDAQRSNPTYDDPAYDERYPSGRPYFRTRASDPNYYTGLEESSSGEDQATGNENQTKDDEDQHLGLP